MRLLACLLFIIFPLLTINVQAQGSCGASLLGQPCAFGGIASLGSLEPSINIGAGNPVHLASGNKYQHEIDLPPNPAYPLLEVARHYNSLDQRTTHFGTGWTLSYDTRLFWANGRWQIVQADGSRITLQPDTQQGQAGTDSHGQLVQQDRHWLWIWPSNHQLLFNTDGQLIHIKYPGKAGSLAIDRHEAAPLRGAINRIRSSTGHTLTFHYRESDGRFYVYAIDTPKGRFRYHYLQNRDHLQLHTVTRPDNMQRRYLYEPQHQGGNHGLLSAIQIISDNRQHTLPVAGWSYNTQRRVSQFRPAAAQSQHAFRIYYNQDPDTQNRLTTLQHANGSLTQLEFASRNDQHLLVAIHKASCPDCTHTSTRIGHDHNGHLQTLDTLHIQRKPDKTLQLEPLVSGWPGLKLYYSDPAQRSAWYSLATGLERSHFTADRQIRQRQFANGGYWHYRYNQKNQLRQITTGTQLARDNITLDWQNDRPHKIRNRYETELRQYDLHQNLQRKTVIRYPSTGFPIPLVVTDRLTYTPQGRIATHQLPEGGALHYRYNPDGKLASINWLSQDGRQQPIIDSSATAPGYRYGNGLHLQVLWHAGQVRMIDLANEAGPIWTAYHDYGLHNVPQADSYAVHPAHLPQAPITLLALAPARPVSESTRTASHTNPIRYSDSGLLTYEHWNYGHHPDKRLHSAGSPNTLVRHAWASDGSAIAWQKNGNTQHQTIQRDPSGLPASIRTPKPRRLIYGPGRRLEKVVENHQPIAQFRHNAAGHRITTLTPHSTRHYFYLDNRVVAETHTAKHNGHSLWTRPTQSDQHPSPLLITRRYIYADQVPVGLIDYTPEHPNGTLFYVHAGLLGAPRVITDQSQHIRWLAAYTPTGQASQLAGDLDMELRLPGQIHDPSTGWHDNIWRTYRPDAGDYLEPDPLGPIPGSQAFGYAAQQPRRFVDPSGLILFAFDGTRNSPATQTNVWKLSQSYLDGPVFYHAGPGNSYYIDWDSITASSAGQILENQWQSLLNVLENTPVESGDTVPIDIIGYSRGAALARHFSNQIGNYVSQGLFSYQHPLRGLIRSCVDLRFIGLFDTVSQFGVAGISNGQYDLTLSSSWAWVAHAVALHERRWLFPLNTVGPTTQDNSIEAPFIGAHADIGGGLAISSRDSAIQNGDLANVALNWILWQARAAAVPFGNLDAADREISAPILHDERPTAGRIINTDRRVDAAEGWVQYLDQDNHPTLGRQQREATETLIARYEDWRTNSRSAVGTIDMDGYARWLQQEVGWLAPPA